MNIDEDLVCSFIILKPKDTPLVLNKWIFKFNFKKRFKNNFKKFYIKLFEF